MHNKKINLIYDILKIKSIFPKLKLLIIYFLPNFYNKVLNRNISNQQFLRVSLVLFTF